MKRILPILLLLFAGELFAQQDAQYTQYMYNTLAINPAYAGSRGVLSVAGLHRSQWIGLDGAPSTQTFNLHAPISEKMGAGLSIVNDEIGNGTNQDTYFDAVFSYTISTSYNSRVSFGLKAGGHLLNIDFNRLQEFNPSANVTQESNIDNRFSPNFGAGVYYYSPTFYAGLSVPNFLETEHFQNSGSSSFLAQERMNFYFISGVVYDFRPDWKFKPTILLKAVQGAPLQADLSANFMYKETFTFGAAYRWSAAWSALFGYQISDQFMLGLAYDRETTELGNSSFNNGSFEVFLRFEFLTQFKKVVTPRFF
ncbi:PorP/SprF family type IX secretion system membrane protein [Croceivirga thetidis]|uniref:Type IX secretion system membrane protein PorP/SprF n=1 Tax=Croceivirga thetidis TaxID=2721623 RepID=A0ABX1GPL2_9FLAO|nr:type IX secretion system membrane protein PorP/SprF [Croceivirga thetidis]NKI30702.1 type IX secretion system membrane protein PorP/SprF [Croceivirga thetidis]